jgi:hypothetical protein
MQKKKVPWYLRPGGLVTIILSLGPLPFLAIPLFWIHPNFSRRQKIVWTVVVLILTWILCWLMFKSFQAIVKLYGILDQLMR